MALIVAQLQDATAKRFELTHDGVIRMLIEDRHTARELGQMASAVRADELIGKHLGMFKDRVEVSGRIEHVVAQLEGLSLDELRAMYPVAETEALPEGREPNVDV